ncbi:MAG: 2-hydroxyacid dehydrogenase [Desulfosudaceae bacterium]
MKPSVYITRKIPESGPRLLQERCQVTVYEENHPIEKKDLAEAVSQSDALICLLSDKIDADLLDRAGRLKIIANYAVGYNNIDVAAARERNILVTHTPGVLTNATAELAFALIISLTRRILPADRFTREGRFAGWDPLLMLGDELAGKTLGVIGMGRIGRDLAAKCRAFGMSVAYYNRTPLDRATETTLKAVHLPLDELLATSDVISVHVPLTEETRHLIDRAALARIRPEAYLINTARGEVIDEAALAEALAAGRLRGAGLDVYEHEPAVNRKLLELDNVVLLPHIGSATTQTRDEMSRMAARNVLAALEGAVPENLVPEMAGSV